MKILLSKCCDAKVISLSGTTQARHGYICEKCNKYCETRCHKCEKEERGRIMKKAEILKVLQAEIDWGKNYIKTQSKYVPLDKNFLLWERGFLKGLRQAKRLIKQLKWERE